MKQEVRISAKTIEDNHYGVPAFYRLVAKEMGIEDEQVESYDCKKIRIAENLFDSIEKTYQGDDVAFGMIWVSYGPKVDENLEDNLVEVEEGFITLKGEVTK